MPATPNPWPITQGGKSCQARDAEFKDELARKVPRAKLIQRIVEGLEAKKVMLVQFEGEYTDQRYLVDHSERRRYAELTLELFGFLKEQGDLSGPEEVPVTYELNVHSVSNAREKLLRKLGGGEVGDEEVTDPEPGSDDGEADA